MSRTETVTRTLYKYSELTADAQSRARDWYREATSRDGADTLEHIVEDFEETARVLGFHTCGSNPNRRPVGNGIYWSGFSSQGDGACFEGSWYASDVRPSKVAELIADRPIAYKDADGASHPCPGNVELIGIARRLMAWTEAHPGSSASLTHCGHYYHEMAVDIDVDCGDDDTFREIARDLMRYLYRSLEREYEYVNSDAAVAESIECNEYEFTEDGERA